MTTDIEQQELLEGEAPTDSREYDEEESDIITYRGTISSSVVNLANTILGSGLLAMPSALAATGLGLGIVLITFCATASLFGLFLLSRLAANVGRKSSFFTCASITYPNAAVYFDFAIAVKCFGVSISYLVIIGGLVPQIVGGLFPSLAPDSIWHHKQTYITLSMLVIAPFCYLRKLDSLRYTSAFSLVAVAYLLFVVLLFFIAPSESMPVKPSFSDIQWIKFDSGVLSHLPIFVFAFTCHQNLFSIHNELQDNSSSQVDKVIQRAIGISFSVYQTVGVIGYLTFGSDVSSNIIALYPSSDIVTLAQIAIVFLVLFSYPLQCHPCRNSLDTILPGRESTLSKPRFVSLTAVIMLASYLIAMSVSDLSLVLALVGATGSTTICYILPGIFYWKLCEDQRRGDSKISVLQYAAGGLVVLGVVVMSSSLYVICFGRVAGHF